MMDNTTDRKAPGDEILHQQFLTNLFKMITDCNQLLMREESEDSLLGGILQSILEHGAFPYSWIILFDPAEPPAVNKVIRHQNKDIREANSPDAAQEYILLNFPSILPVLRSQDYYIEHDILVIKKNKSLQQEAHRLNYRSFLALPLAENEKVYGMMVVFSSRPAGFEEKVVKLFIDLAGDLSAGINSLRTKEELKSAQEQLIESQNMLKLVMDTIPIRLFWKDKNFKYLGCNKAFATDAGLKSPEEIVGKNDFQLSWKETAPLYRADDKEIIEKKISKINYEEPQVREDGTSSWLRTTKIPLLDKNGAILGLFGSYEDITERKKAEEALWESEHRYKMATTAANVGVWDLNLSTSDMYIDPILKALLGFDDNEMENRESAWNERIHPDDLTSVQSEIRSYIQGKIPRLEINVRMIHRDGSIKWFSVRGTVLTDTGGNPYRMVGTSTDITSRMQMEMEKENMRAQLLQAQKMEAVGTLAGGMAHDFNNLLTTIKGYTDLSLMDLTDNNPVFHNLKQIQKAVSRASTLTNQLLLFSRRHLMEPISLNLNETIKNMLLLLERVIGEDIRIETEFQPDLWKIRADEGNLEQVIMNLAVNSRDAMPKGGRIIIQTRNVVVEEDMIGDMSKSRPGKFVRLTFRDTGVGMEEETLKHIFEPFFTTKEVGKGTGLGLSVIYGIINQHEGWITVDSRLNKGAVFQIYIPASALKTPAGEDTLMSQEDYRGQGETLLVVEDEEGICEFMSTLLMEKGYNVLCAGTVDEASRQIEKAGNKLSLIITDVVLPDRSGLELAEDLRKKKPDLGIILTSGYTGDKTNWEMIMQKGYRFLKKPFAIAELLHAIHVILDRQRK